MPSKYDTNQLDPEFPEKARAAAAQADAQANGSLPYTGAETRPFTGGVATEETTRRFSEPDVRAYSQAYAPPYAPMGSSVPPYVSADQARKRKVEKVGLPENVMVAAPYLPFSIGLAAGLIELLVVPSSEAKVRFHAAQGLAAHSGMLIIGGILAAAGRFTGTAAIGGEIFGAVTVIMMIIFTIKAWKGKPIHIESIDSVTNWLEEKIRIKS